MSKKTAQHQRALLLQSVGLVPSTGPSTHDSSSRGSDALFWLYKLLYTCDTYKLIQIHSIDIINYKKKKTNPSQGVL